jgi:hypothetical protein
MEKPPSGGFLLGDAQHPLQVADSAEKWSNLSLVWLKMLL